MKKFIFTFLILLSTIFVNGQFGDEKIIFSDQPNNITQISVTDINNDGFNDVVVSSETEGKVWWYKNQNGIISLANTLIVAYPSISSFDCGDIDGDGLLDLLYTSNNSEVLAWAKNNGTNNLFIDNNISQDSTLLAKIVDLNQDGQNDIVAIIENGRKLVWYENLTGSSFSSQILIDSISNLSYPFFDVYVQDLNADGKMDILPSDGFNVTWHENLGGNFNKNTLTKPLVNSTYDELRPGMITPDTLVDILATGLGVYEDLGSGYNLGSYTGFSTQGPLDEFTLFDIDKDGDEDVTMTYYTSASNRSLLMRYDNTGNALNNYLYYQTISSATSSVRCLIANGDLDNDGFEDVVVALTDNSNNDLSWFKNSAGTFNNDKKSFSMNIDAGTNIKPVDIDNNGMEDFLIINDGIFSLENRGNNIFESFIIHDETGMINGSVVDFNLDGRKDVIACGVDDIYWFENLGGGNFSSSQFIYTYGPSLPNIVAINAFDFEKDGDIDIVFRTYYGIFLLTNNGGTFTRTSTTSFFNGNAGDSDIELTDFNQDGNIDFTTIHLHVNDSTGFFNYQTGFFKTKDGIIDCDLDGDMDVIGSGINNNLHWTEYDSLSLVGNNEITTTGNISYSNQKLPFDVNGDGFYDVLYSDNAGNVNVLIQDYDTLNFGAINFLFKPEGDVKKFFKVNQDGDASTDIVVRTEGDTILTSFRNFYKSPYRAIGKTYIDLNQNSNFDTNDVPLQAIQIVTQPVVSSSYSNSSGDFILATIDSVNLTLSYTPINFWSLTTDSLSYSFNLNSVSPLQDSLDFGFFPDSLVNDINAEIIGGFPRCNDVLNYWLDVKNNGTTTPSGVIHLQLDDSISYIGSAIPPDSINGQNIYWFYDSLFYFSHEQINLQVLMPDFNSIGDSLTSFLNISVIDSLGNFVFLASDTLNPILVCAYDPNDKIADPLGIDSLGYISANTESIEYIIRFQNTGNDTAITVNILDQLDTNLFWNTLSPIASSHEMAISVDQNGEVTFTFNNIQLPDSGSNFLGSQGFVKYKIDLKPNLAPGTRIYNTANIYFDQNPAVITNTKIHTIYDCNGFVQNTISNFSVCQNDSVFGSASDDLPTTEFSWIIPNIYNSMEPNFNWFADTSGVFDLELTTSNAACTKDTIITLTISPSYNPNQNNSICPGDSMLVYGIYQSAAGVYYDSLQTINGCDSIISTTLSINTVYSSNQNDSICQGDSLLIYGVYQNSAGIYYDSLQTINGCDSLYSITLAVKTLPTVTLVPFNPDTICDNGGGVALPVGTPLGGTYSGSGVGGGNFDPTVSGLGTHNVIYAYTDGNTCVNSDTIVITVELCIGINDLADDFGILIYPNPSNGLFTIEKPNGLNTEVQINLLDATSRLIIVDKIPVGKKRTEIDITKNSKGIYYLQLIVDEKVFVKKILKD